MRTASEKARESSEFEMVEMEYGEYLYDLDKDPNETTNLKSEFPEKFKELKSIHKNCRKEIDQSNK